MKKFIPVIFGCVLLSQESLAAEPVEVVAGGWWATKMIGGGKAMWVAACANPPAAAAIGVTVFVGGGLAGAGLSYYKLSKKSSKLEQDLAALRVRLDDADRAAQGRAQAEQLSAAQLTAATTCMEKLTKKMDKMLTKIDGLEARNRDAQATIKILTKLAIRRPGETLTMSADDMAALSASEYLEESQLELLGLRARRRDSDEKESKDGRAESKRSDGRRRDSREDVRVAPAASASVSEAEVVPVSASGMGLDPSAPSSLSAEDEANKRPNPLLASPPSPRLVAALMGTSSAPVGQGSMTPPALPVSLSSGESAAQSGGRRCASEPSSTRASLPGAGRGLFLNTQSASDSGRSSPSGSSSNSGSRPGSRFEHISHADAQAS